MRRPKRKRVYCMRKHRLGLFYATDAAFRRWNRWLTKTGGDIVARARESYRRTKEATFGDLYSTPLTEAAAERARQAANFRYRRWEELAARLYTVGKRF